MEASSNNQLNLKNVKFELLDVVTKESLRRAVEVRQKAYCPYSKFQVGASVVTTDNSIFTGCNVENATFTGICAERTAYSKAISEGHITFKSISVIGFQENVTAPCGTCRQFMAEFGDIIVYMAKPSLDQVFLCNLSDLLPLMFSL